MFTLTFRSHKAGQGTTVTACAAACALAAAGKRVAIVTNDLDTLPALGAATTGEIKTEVRDGLDVLDVSRLPLDAVSLAGLLGLSDSTPAYDVAVLDLGDDTPTAATLNAHGFTAEAVEVVTADYLALRRSTMATHAGAERQHVVLIVEAGRVLSVADVRSVLSPSGQLVEVPRDAAVARQVDAGLLAHRAQTAFADLAAFVEAVTIPRADLDAADAALKARRTAKGARK